MLSIIFFVTVRNIKFICQCLSPWKSKCDCVQGLLLGVLLSCNFIRSMKEENMQNLCTSLEKDSLILVSFFSLSQKRGLLVLIIVDKLLHFVIVRSLVTELSFLNPSHMLILTVFCVAAVRKEIADETDRETGRSKQISSVPIHLSIYSPNGEIELLLILYFLL